jgi:hypothetical protein
MTEGQPLRQRSWLQVLAVGLFASPAAAAWMTADDLAAAGHLRRARWTRLVGLAATLGVALFVVLARVRWVVTSTVWVLFCLAGTAAVAAWRRALIGGPAAPSRPSHEGRARDALRALAVVLFVMPPLMLFTHLVGAASIGWLLVRLDPQAADPEAAFEAIFWGIFWGVPSGAAFVLLSIRRGRLGSAADLAIAALSFTWILLWIEIVVSGSVHALRTLMFGAELFSETGAAPGAILQTVFFVAAVPLALDLAWGEGPGRRRLLRATTLALAGLVNLGLALGYPPRVQFVVARQVEKSGRAAAALRWYGRALTARSTPLIESYLQHRIGLLNHKLGREDQALTAFRLVQTTRNANTDLVRQSAYYLERLAREEPGRRVVLEGVEVETELRDAYCAPNTLALVLNYWGHPLSPREIGEKVAAIGGGTALSSIRFLCEENGLDHLVVPFATVDDIRWQVDRGLPVLAYLPGHVLAIFGYDTRLGTLVAYDTATWDIWVDEPLPDFLETWGKTSFLMGVVLPRDDRSPAAAEARRRFGNRSPEAAWHWWLSREADPGERAAQLRAAVALDPSFYPAAFELLKTAPSDRAWLDQHVDAPRLLTRARALLDREHAPMEEIASGLSRWLLAHGQWREVLSLADGLERRGQLDTVRVEAGVAAARLGLWERAAFLLGGDSVGGDAEAGRALARAQAALGRKDAVSASAVDLIRRQSGDVLEEALALAEPTAGSRGPGFLAEVYRAYLKDRPYDAPRQLRMAELYLAAVRQESGKDGRRRLHLARRAALTAAALAARPDDRRRAEVLMSRLDGADREFGGEQVTPP